MLLTLQIISLLFMAVAFLHLRNRMKRLERGTKEDYKKLIHQLRSLRSAIPKAPAAMVPKSTLSYRIAIKDGPPIQVEVPTPQPQKGGPFFAMGPHKSGTVLLNTMLKDLAHATQVPFFELLSELFIKGVDVSKIEDVSGLFNEKGIMHAGFRTGWIGGRDIVLPHGAKAVVLVRDPRDILVSMYYSVAKSHTLPEGGNLRDVMLKHRVEAENMDIDSWVVGRAKGSAVTFNRWADWVSNGGPDKVKVYRYEDVIFEKERWLADMNEWFGWQAPTEAVRQIAAKHDIRPTDEDASRHIRKVAPGDHMEKLKPETIAQINEILRGPAARFGYEL
jgi:hypothetical protein